MNSYLKSTSFSSLYIKTHFFHKKVIHFDKAFVLFVRGYILARYKRCYFFDEGGVKTAKCDFNNHKGAIFL